MTTGTVALCPGCANLDRGPHGLGQNRNNPTLGIPTCTAFPTGIPLAIWAGGFDHRQEFAGDGGVRFEPAPLIGERVVQMYDGFQASRR